MNWSTKDLEGPKDGDLVRSIFFLQVEEEDTILNCSSCIVAQGSILCVILLTCFFLNESGKQRKQCPVRYFLHYNVIKTCVCAAHRIFRKRLCVLFFYKPSTLRLQTLRHATISFSRNIVLAA